MGNVIQHNQRINSRWFRERLEDRQISQRKLAKEIGIDPSAVSLMLRGLREIKLEEAIELARILGVPKDEVLANIGVDLSDDKGVDKLNVSGFVGEGGVVQDGKPGGPRLVPTPPGVPDGTTALRIQNSGPYDGWVVYYKPVDYVMPEAVGRMAIVELESGQKVIRAVRHGYSPGEYKTIDVTTGEFEMGRIRSASLVLWMKQ